MKPYVEELTYSVIETKTAIKADVEAYLVEKGLHLEHITWLPDKPYSNYAEAQEAAETFCRGK